MTAAGGSLLDRLERGDADAEPVGEDGDAGESSASAEELTAAIVRAADALPDEARALAAWDEAGALHRPETLDAALASLTGFRPFGFLKAGRKRRILRVARAALRRTSHPGALRLAVAFVGELGGAADVPALATVARHPRFALHAVTALTILRTLDARMAMLRLLAETDGEHRVLVIDRLLPHVRQPAVRLALVRDALTGLAAEHARDVAPAIAEACRCRELAEDAGIEPSIRDAARAVLAAAAGAADVAAEADADVSREMRPR